MPIFFVKMALLITDQRTPIQTLINGIYQTEEIIKKYLSFEHVQSKPHLIREKTKLVQINFTCYTDNKEVPKLLSYQPHKIRGIVQSTFLMLPCTYSLRGIYNYMRYIGSYFIPSISFSAIQAMRKFPKFNLNLCTVWTSS